MSHRLTYRVFGDVRSFQNNVYCYRNDYKIARLPTINGMPRDGHHSYVPYPSILVGEKFWIADGYGLEKKPTEREWSLAKNLDRYRWWQSHYDEILKGCLDTLNASSGS